MFPQSLVSLLALHLTLGLASQLTDHDILTARNSTLFSRWRPRSHFIAPHSWLNDPCGALYDPATDKYHLHYQFHPNHVNWGNISWGHAISDDLFHWKDIRSWENDSSVSLAAGRFESNTLSQFTGTSQPFNLQGEQDGTLLTFATGIHHLPTNWKIPYTKGTEIQALYVSEDGGESWSEVGTVLPDPPQGWNVTGWRDPSFFPSPELDGILGVDEPHFYMVLGSGLKGLHVPAVLEDARRPDFIGPRIPLYTAPASDLTQWSFLGALWEPVANTSLGEPDVTGSYGYNFEVSSFLSLPIPNSGELAWFVTMGSEGGNTTLHPKEQWALWNRGSLSRRTNSSIELTPLSGGALDWGIGYAQAVFVDKRKGNENRHVLWGWVNEDIEEAWFFNTSRAMGYQGSMALPMELFVLVTEEVMKTDVQDGNVWVEGHNGDLTAQTLGIRPLPEVLDMLHNGAEEQEFYVGELSSSSQKVTSDTGNSFMLTATLTDLAGTAAIVIGQSPDNQEHTTIFINAANHTIGVNRLHSSSLSAFRNYTHHGYFVPYTFIDGSVEGVNFLIVYDHGLLEVFVNDRFVLTTRIYPSRKDSTGLSFVAVEHGDGDSDGNGGQESSAVWNNVKLYKGLANAWPQRPEDTSVPLVWDSVADTNNYTWWAGF